jgi:hypothetical protein
MNHSDAHHQPCLVNETWDSLAYLLHRDLVVLVHHIVAAQRAEVLLTIAAVPHHLACKRAQVIAHTVVTNQSSRGKGRQPGRGCR